MTAKQETTGARPWPKPDEGRGPHWARLGVQWLLVVGVNGRWQDTLGYHLPDRVLADAEYHGPVLTPGENSPADAPFADTDRLTCRDPDLDMDALERAHGRVLTMYRSCVVGGAASVAAEWEALLVASGHGWPSTPKEASK